MFPVSEPVVLVWGCLGLMASGSEMLVSCLDPRSHLWGEGMVALPLVPTNASKAHSTSTVWNEARNFKIWDSTFCSSAVLPKSWPADLQPELGWSPSALNQGLRTLWWPDLCYFQQSIWPHLPISLLCFHLFLQLTRKSTSTSPKPGYGICILWGE